jgi:hypothetical protein
MNRVFPFLLMIALAVLLAPSARGAAPQVVEFRDSRIQPGDPVLSRRLLSDADLDSLSLVELTLLRDGIYGRYGHIFREPWVQAYFNTQSWYRARKKVRPADLTAIERKNAERLADREQRFDVGELRVRYDNMSPDGDYTDQVERSLIGENIRRLEAADALKFKRLFTLAALRKMSRGELSVLRNEIYARHGYVFHDPVIRDFFVRRPWYKADPHYSDTRLTVVDRQNVLLIRQVEKEKGGPLMEVDRVYGGA